MSFAARASSTSRRASFRIAAERFLYDHTLQVSARLDGGDDFLHGFDACLVRREDGDRVDVFRHVGDRFVDLRLTEAAAAAKPHDGFVVAAASQAGDL